MSMTRSLLMPSKTKLVTQSGEFTAELGSVNNNYVWIILLTAGSITFPKAFKEPPVINIVFNPGPGDMNITAKCTVTTTGISWPTHQIGNNNGPIGGKRPGTWTATGYI